MLAIDVSPLSLKWRYFCFQQHCLTYIRMSPTRWDFRNVRNYGHFLFTFVKWDLLMLKRQIASDQGIWSPGSYWSLVMVLNVALSVVVDVSQRCLESLCFEAPNHIERCKHRLSRLLHVAIHEPTVRNRWFSMKHIVAENENEKVLNFELIFVKTKNLPHHSCKCSWCKDLGKQIRQQQSVFHQLYIPKQHFHAMRSNQSVALSDMELEDSWKQIICQK